jgi:hypothetical protein
VIYQVIVEGIKGHIWGVQIGPMSLENIPVVQRNKQKDFGFQSLHVQL